MPGVVYLEMVIQAAKEATENRILGLSDIQWLKPIIVDVEVVKVKTCLVVDNQGVEFEIFTEEPNRDIFCSGRIIIEGFSSVNVERSYFGDISIPAMSDLAVGGISVGFDEINLSFEKLGFSFGDTFKVIQDISYSDEQSIGYISPVDTIDDGYTLYPSLLDGAIRTSIAIGGYGFEKGMPVPIAAERLVLRKPLTKACKVFSRLTSDSSHRSSYDILIVDASDELILAIYGFVVQRVVKLSGVKAKRTSTPAEISLREDEKDRSLLGQTTKSSTDIQQSISSYLKTLVAGVTKVPKNQIETDEAFEKYGIDSVMIMTMNEKLRGFFGDDIPQTLFFEYQNIDELREYFEENYSDKFSSSEGEATDIDLEPVNLVSQKSIDNDIAESDKTLSLVTDYLIGTLSAVTKIPITNIDVDESLDKYGVDSVMIMSMNEKLEKVFGDSIPKTLFFEFQDISGLAEYFCENYREEIINNFYEKKLIVPLNQEPLNSNMVLESDSFGCERSRELISRIFREELNTQESEEISNKPLCDMGIDAVAAMRIDSKLNKQFPSFKSRRICEFRTINECISAIADESLTSPSDMSVAPEVSIPKAPLLDGHTGSKLRMRRKHRFTQEHDDDPIAIVGLAGRYPQANSLDEFWLNLSQGKDSIIEIPKDRWDYKKNYSSDRTEKGKVYGKWGGFLDSIDQFDPEYFNITLREAEKIDPQERLFLQSSWECFEDAGFTRKSIKGASIGVFVGVMWGLYQFTQVSQKQIQFGKPMSLFSSIANRVSYTFDLNGPSLALDTMCSSSMTALQVACQNIQRGDCDMAIAGGVNLAAHPIKYEFLSQTQFLSSDGRCRAFGDGGTGYVPGEGVGTVLLKPLSKAVEDGDQIYGVIQSTALNHGGKTNGYTVPNQKAQTAVITKALKRANWPVESISYIEAHGTGTSLGDPIEIAALTRALKDVSAKSLPDDFKCDIGSVKSNFGHLESAAGIASLTKVLLQLKHKKIAPSLHSSVLNKNINFELTPLVVPQKLKNWLSSDKNPRRAGISAFGAGGSNAHILIEEFEGKPISIQHPERKVLFILSADSTERLKAYAARIAAWLPLVDNRSELFLHRLAYSSQVGRDQCSTRLVIYTNSFDEIEDALNSYIVGEDHIALSTGIADSENNLNKIIDEDEKRIFLDSIIEKSDWERLARVWTSSLDIDWFGIKAKLFPELIQLGTEYLRKVSFPPKPFIEQKVWLDVAGDFTQVSKCLHPLVDVNHSTLFEQIFTKTFTGEEFYLGDHIVNTGEPRVILPGVAYLEIARVCAEQSVGGEYSVCHIRNLLWAAPIEIRYEPQNVLIRLIQDESELAFEIIDREKQEIIFCQGDVVLGRDSARDDEWIDLDRLRSAAHIVEDHEDIYREFTGMGFEYGESYRVTRRRFRIENKQALSELILPDLFESTLLDFVLHPCLMDAAVRTGLAADFEPGEMPKYPIVPFGVEDVEIVHPLEKHCFAFAYLADESGSNSKVKKYQILVTNSEGKILVKLHNFSATSFIKNSEEVKRDVSLFEYQWVADKITQTQKSVYSSVLSVGFNKEELNAFQSLFDCIIIDLQLSEVDSFSSEENSRILKWTVDNQESVSLQKFVRKLNEKSILPDLIFYKASREKLSVDKHPSYIQNLATILQAMEIVSPLRSYKLVAAYNQERSFDKPFAEAVSGFAKSFVAVNHRFKMVTVALEASQTVESNTARLVNEAINENNSASEVRYRENVREMRCLVPIKEIIQSDSVLISGGSYLITGGMGKLGLIIARYLAQEYSANLLLTGRSPVCENIQLHLQNLREWGGRVEYLPADITDINDVTNLVSFCKEEFNSLNGVIHSAGLVDSKSLLELKIHEFDEIMRPKIEGTIALDKATAGVKLDVFLLFSSISAIVGDLGSGSYACSNRFMDAFAQLRQENVILGKRSGLTLSVNWPLWEQGGMEIPDDQRALFEFSGIQPMTESQGLRAFESILRYSESNLLVAAGNAEKLKQYLRVKECEVSENLTEKSNINQSRNPIVSTVSPASVFKSENSVDDHEIPATDNANKSLLEYLQNEIAYVTKLSPEKINKDTRFEGFGMDSVMLMELQNRLKNSFDKLPKTILFEHDTLSKLEDFIAEKYASAVKTMFNEEKLITDIPEEISVTQSMNVAKNPIVSLSTRKGKDKEFIKRNTVNIEKDTIDNDIAVIGIGARFPHADTLDQFWEILSSGSSVIQEIPESRWSASDYYSQTVGRVYNKAVSKWGGFIDDIDNFDNEFFKIKLEEACKLDPQVKLLLEAAWNAIEDSAYVPDEISHDRVGVFIGSMSDDFSRVVADGWHKKKLYFGPGAVASELSNRISYFFNFNGPSMSVQTACSSSATAIHLARKALLTGECRYAFAGGVNVSLHPSKYLMLQEMKVLSPDGKESTFDEEANGLVPSEGVGIILLKRYQDAIADGDNIYGIIKASGVSHAGVGAGQFLPNLNDMAKTASDVIEDAKVSATDISYIECHGTGTELGDPIELKAMEKAVSKFTDKKNFCVLGTKANLGHMEAASGICSVIKVLLSMKNRSLSPCANLQNENSVYEIENSPFLLPREMQSWKAQGGSFLAGVNSFGMGGANVFMLLSSAERLSSREREEFSELPILFSANSMVQLKDYVESFHSHFNNNPNLNLDDVAYTTQVGRVSMRYRLAFVVNSLASFCEKSSQWLKDTEGNINGVVIGDPKNKKVGDFTKLLKDESGDKYVNNLLSKKNILPLVSLWTMGADIDWRKLYQNRHPEKISLPGYPWCRVDTRIERVMDSANEDIVQETSSKKYESKKDHLIVGSWFSINKKDLDITDLVFDKERLIGGKIFSGDDWKQSYWNEYLNEFKAISASEDKNNVVRKVGNEYTHLLRSTDVQFVQGFCNQYELEIETLFVAGWSLLLSRLRDEKVSQFIHSVSNERINEFIPFRVPCVVRKSSLEWLRNIQTERLIKHVASDSFVECFGERKHYEYCDSFLAFNKKEVVKSVMDELRLSIAVNIGFTNTSVEIHLGSNFESFMQNSLEEIALYLLGFVTGMAKAPERNPAALGMKLPKEKSSKNVLRILDSEGEQKI